MDGSTYSPLSISVINLAHSVCAWRFVPLKLCHSAAAGAIGDAGKARMAELLPHQKASDPIPDPVVAALKDIQLVQQQHVASLQENSSLLQRNTALLEQDSTTLASLRESITDEHVDVKKMSGQITDEHVDVKKMSGQISTLIAKVDSLKNAITPEVTSSIPKGRARNRLSRVVRNRMARQPKLIGPVSVGGAPLSLPATAPHTEG
jgi:septal ring factor EnvC (AmiA/AmiB activator)